MNKKKKILTIFGIFILSIFVFFFKIPYWTALTKSKSHFIENTTDKRILYELGAKEYSDKFADFLPVAVRIIEEKHFNPFSKSFKVYICNTQKSLGEFVAAKSLYPVRGLVLRGDIYIAPSAFNFKGKDTHKETIKHELSHLQFRQRLGFIKDRKIPAWFREGFADYVSGAGGEGIEESEAIDFIKQGRHFIPEEEGEVFGSIYSMLNGLSGPMFHKQVKMFVTYLIESDSTKFKSFLRKIQDGEHFHKSFNVVIGTDIQEKWTQFISHLDSKL